jgi:hypothetical protein
MDLKTRLCELLSLNRYEPNIGGHRVNLYPTMKKERCGHYVALNDLIELIVGKEESEKIITELYK